MCQLDLYFANNIKVKLIQTYHLSLQFLLYVASCYAQTTVEPSTTSLSSSPSGSSTSTEKLENSTAKIEKYSAVYEAHARHFLQIGQKGMELIYNHKRDLFHGLTKKRISFSDINQAIVQREIDNDYHDLVRELAANLSVIPVQQLKNMTLRRQVQRLSKLQLHGLNKHDYERSKTLLSTMHTFITTPMVCQNDCSSPSDKMVAMEPTIRSLVEHNKNKDTLYFYWLKWRHALSKEDNMAQDAFLEYVDLWRKAAAYNGK